jgi:predicted dehydrogenase
MATLAGGATARLQFSAVLGLAPASEAWLYGSEGTLRLELSSLRLGGGRRGDRELGEIAIPKERQVGWRVEEEFVNAIRGKEKVTRTTFEDGVRYMDFTEAARRSAETGRRVALPL